MALSRADDHEYFFARRRRRITQNFIHRYRSYVPSGGKAQAEHVRSLRSLRERKDISEGSLCGKKHLVGVLEIVHYTMNTLHNISDIEIDEQPQSFIHKPEISMQLFVVYGLEFLYGFEFHDDLIVYKEI